MWATSNEDGLFESSTIPESANGVPSVLWVTHARFAPVVAYVQSVGGELQFPTVISMVSADPIQVRVVDVQGAPVSQAEIEQTTPIPSSAMADRFDPQARRVLRRTTSTGIDGLAEIATWDGPLLLRATRDGLASEAWIGDPRPMVQLELRETFEVGGTVTLEAGSSIEGEQRIVCQVQKGTQIQPLAIASVSGGAWGPVNLPLLEVDRYRFRIEGWNAEVREHALEPPAPGARIRVDFTLRAGSDVYTFVHDEEESPIPGSTSTVIWDQDGVRVEATGHPREDGHTVIRGVPPGTISVDAQAPGYVPKLGGPWEIPEPELLGHWIKLVRGRRIEGRVLWKGQPVEDFEISYGPENLCDRILATFRERSDGSFVLEAAPTGALRVSATAQGASPSETVVISPGDTSPPPLVLELREFVRGKGQVVDAATGEGLPDAKIQPFLAYRAFLGGPWGPALQVKRDGAFDSLSFAPSRQRVRFSAPGYSLHWAETFAQVGETIDFGIVPLHERQDLVLQLVSDGEQDFTKFAFTAIGDDVIGEHAFGADGRLVIEDVSAGRYQTCVYFEGGAELRENLVLQPADDWHFELPVGGKHKLRITAAPSPGLEGAQFAVTLPHPERIGVLLTRQVLPDRAFEVSSLFAGEFRVAILSIDGTTLGFQAGEIQPDDSVIPVHVDVDSPGHRFRLVDSEGFPVPRVRLRLYSLDAQHLRGLVDTDEAGEGAVTGLSPGPYRAYLDHPDRGYDFDKPVDVPAPSEEPVVIVFSPENAVEVQLMDGLDPLPAVSCRLVEEHVSYTLPASASDAAGVVCWKAIGKGRFKLGVQQTGLWPTEAMVEALPPGHRTEVQVRRLGDLDVNVDRVSGTSTGGLELELESVEFAASAATWIADGRAMSSTSSLALDGKGRLSLTGLPHGLYRWAIGGQEGTVEVHVASRDELTVLLP